MTSILGFSSLGRAQSADFKAACAEAYVETQSLRRAGDLTQARAKALQCAEASCPPVTTKDCSQWLGEIDASLPSVVFHVRDEAGRDVTEVQITMDGQKLAARADGAELQLNPGRHAFRFEVAGKRAVEQEAVLSVGEKRRTLEATFESDKPKPPPPSPAPPPPERRPHLTTAAAVFGVVGVLGAGAFATFGALGLKQRDDLRDTCQPRCSDADVAHVRWKLTAADVSLGVGAASLAVAVVLFVRGAVPAAPPAKAARALKLGITPLARGGFVGVESSF